MESNLQLLETRAANRKLEISFQSEAHWKAVEEGELETTHILKAFRSEVEEGVDGLVLLDRADLEHGTVQKDFPGFLLHELRDSTGLGQERRIAGVSVDGVLADEDAHFESGLN